jgi:transcriptional pleiotropic regulator of transition state genes
MIRTTASENCSPPDTILRSGRRHKMHDTGIVRRVDDLGRIVIPMELRRTLGIEVKDSMKILVEDDRIILEKYFEKCALCRENKATAKFKDKPVCDDCVNEIKKRK